MKSPIHTINDLGLNEIKEFLAKNHKKGDVFDREMLLAWAAEAEFQLSEGNPAVIEIRAWDTLSGRTEEYRISDHGVNTEMFDFS